MASESKEENILRLILENSPLKEWHFEQLVKETKVTRAAVSKWLRKYEKEGLIKRVKLKEKFPFFTVGQNNPVYYSRKKIYALEKLYKSGLVKELLSLESAKTVIIFGSMIKGDWYRDSDIDIFVYGKINKFNKHIYEQKIGKNIELHVFESKKEIADVKTGLIKNIINGYLIKGQIQDIAEVA